MPEEQFKNLMDKLAGVDIGPIIIQWYLRQPGVKEIRATLDEGRIIVWYEDGSRTILDSKEEDNSGVTYTPKEDL